tara:strand:+ start:107 stop:721 length:615 start_codon:yes stop_codon:yes gene_type:complete
MNDDNSENCKKLNKLFDKFIQKVKEDSENYENIKCLNKKTLKKIKINSIFLDKNEILNITSCKIKKTMTLEQDINNFLDNNNFLNDFFVRKIIFYKSSINENNIKTFLSFNNDNYNQFYNILSINFFVNNNYLQILDKNQNIKKTENIDNFFFLEDLDCIYLFFEKKEIEIISSKPIQLFKTLPKTKKKNLLKANNKTTKKNNK